MLSERFDEALRYARTQHADHHRKGSAIPYLSHLIQVSGLVLEFGGDEDEAIVGLLHDAPEDTGGEPVLREIQRRFGDKVAAYVEENSDSLVEDALQKADWHERKAAYLAAIGHKSESGCLVSICDKLHNARSLITDYRSVGEDLWDRFKAGRKDTLAHYEHLVEAFRARAATCPRLQPPFLELEETVRRLVDLTRVL